MAIKDSIVNLKKELRTTLHTVPALIDTLIRGLDGVEEAAEEQSTYSTDEKIVGTWIDGSMIYEKTYTIDELPDATSKTIAIGVTDINEIVGINAIAIHSTTAGRSIALPNLNPGISIYTGDGNITVNAAANFSIYKGVITLRYTKSAPSRTPEENDTKNDGDEEKNNNER